MTSLELAARLDRLPISRFHRRVMYALAFGFFFELADLNTFSYAAPGLRHYMHLSVDQIGLVTSAGFLGMFIGAAFGGFFADRLGRRRMLVASVSWYSVFSFANAAAVGTGTLLMARLLTGVGLGALTVVAITYLSETMPHKHRGRMQGAVLTIGLVGIPVMAFFARGVVPTGPSGWRWVFLFGGVGVFALALVLRLPESPRWLFERGHVREAEDNLAAIEQEVQADKGQLEPASSPDVATTSERGSVADLLRRPMLGRTSMLLVAWIFQTLGFYGFVSWVPTLLAEHGFSLTRSLTFAAITTVGGVPGALFAWPISDRFHRKTPTAVIALLTAACGLCYGLSFNTAAILIFGFLVSFFIQTFAALLYAYTPELYPTSLRNTASGFVYGVGRLANIAGPLFVASIFAGGGYVWVFVYIAACWAIVAAAIGLFGPRSGQRRLEELQSEEAAPVSAYAAEVPVR
jgi:MFS transporter, putative metabolite:H+ symporter